MSYLDDVAAELRAKLGDSEEDGFEEWADDVVKYVKAKLLESFKNGIETERKRKGKPAKQKSNTSK